MMGKGVVGRVRGQRKDTETTIVRKDVVVGGGAKCVETDMVGKDVVGRGGSKKGCRDEH